LRVKLLLALFIKIKKLELIENFFLLGRKIIDLLFHLFPSLFAGASVGDLNMKSKSMKMVLFLLNEFKELLLLLCLNKERVLN
jgi:hypothetical protein